MQNTHRKINFQVEGAVYKLEIAGAALVQRLHLGHEAVQLERPRGFVERAQAKLAFERATPRRLNVQQAFGQVFGRVFGVRQGQLGQRRLLTGNHFHQGPGAIEQRAAQLGKAHIAPAGHDVIGQRANLLPVGFKTDLWPAQHHGDVRPQRL